MRAILLTSFLLVATACGDYEIALPHGYKLGRIYSGAFVVVGPNNRVLVDALHGLQIGRNGDIVFGVADDAPSPAQPVGADRRYFVLNTATGELANSLSEAAYLSRLRAYGVARTQLTRPSRFTRL